MTQASLERPALNPRALPEMVVDRIWRFFCSVRAAIAEIAILAVLVIFSAVGVYPILAEMYHWPSPGWLQQKQLKLGLDLKGGVHLVLRVQRDDAIRLESETEAERLRDTLRTRNIPFTSINTPSISQIRVEGIPPAQDAAFRDASAESMSVIRWRSLQSGISASALSTPAARAAVFLSASWPSRWTMLPLPPIVVQTSLVAS